MCDPTWNRAEQLENLIPTLMRILFASKPNEPLTDLPIAQLRLMRVLFRSEAPMTDLGEELGMSVSAVTQMANRLEAQGLVERVESKQDRRIRVLRLTESGRSLMAERKKMRIEQAARILKEIPEQSQIATIQAIQALVDHSQLTVSETERTAEELQMIAHERCGQDKL